MNATQTIHETSPDSWEYHCYQCSETHNGYKSLGGVLEGVQEHRPCNGKTKRPNIGLAGAIFLAFEVIVILALLSLAW